ITDPEEAAKRDEAIRNANHDWAVSHGVAKMPPIRSGLIAKPGPGRVAQPAGNLSIQGVVDGPKGKGRLDDVYGVGWYVFGRGREALAALTPDDRAFFERIGGRIFAVLQPGEKADTGSFIDVDGTYRRWFEQTGASAIIVRPDFYNFGAARDP